MSDNQESWELDAAWFRKTFPFVATDDEVEYFCVRVHERMTTGMNESRARFESAAELRKRRNGTQG